MTRRNKYDSPDEHKHYKTCMLLPDSLLSLGDELVIYTTMAAPFNAASPLRKSGLVGPVKLVNVTGKK